MLSKISFYLYYYMEKESQSQEHKNHPYFTFKKNRFLISDENFFWVELAFHNNLFVSKTAIKNNNVIDDHFFDLLIASLNDGKTHFYFSQTKNILTSCRKSEKANMEFPDGVYLSYKELFEKFGSKTFLILDEEGERTISYPNHYQNDDIFLTWREANYREITEETRKKVERLKNMHN